MYLRLDDLHRLSYHGKSDMWELLKCVRTTAYTKKKAKGKFKTAPILIDPVGLKAFGRWKRIASYSPDMVSNGLRRWLMTVLSEEFVGEVTSNDIVSILEKFVDRINDVLLMSSILSVTIDVSLPDKKGFEAIQSELRKQKKAIASGNPLGGARPIRDTVVLPEFIQKSGKKYLYRSIIEVKNGTLRIKRVKVPVDEIKTLVKKSTEDMILVTRSLKPGKPGRKAKVVEKKTKPRRLSFAR